MFYQQFVYSNKISGQILRLKYLFINPICSILCMLLLLYMGKYLLSFILFGTAVLCHAQSGNSTCKKSTILLQMLEKYHYQPVTIDDKVSIEIFNDFIHNLDPYGFYFTKSDLFYLSPYRTQVKTNACALVDATIKLYKQKLSRADSFINVITSKPIDPNTSTYLDLSYQDQDTLVLLNNESDLKTKWTQSIQYDILNALLQPTEANPEPLKSDITTLLKNEPAIRTKIKEVEKRRISQKLEAPEGFENYVGNAFLNAIINRFDPHSFYFSPTEKETFMEGVSKDGMSYGFYTKTNKSGATEISRVVPRGNAWKSNQVNIGDIILKIKFDNNTPVELTYVDAYELDEMFDDNKAAQALELTLKKATGQINTVILHKEKTEQDENIVKSYILNGSKKIGYISLPSFYDEWESENPLGCGNDVAKEITKLQNEHIEGLILDVRFNGGGSMREAINLAGIFINEGPICVIKDRKEKPYIIKDMNRGTAYDGPLLVMVNSFSASASEFLSAVLQDYHRAVIVGNTTFGKATAQETMPLDPYYNSKNADPNAESDLGYVNITTEKFYRVTTISHQNKGVQPDIILPQINYFVEETEAKQKYALLSDTIKKNVYFTPSGTLPIAELSRNSQERIKSNNNFKGISALNDSINIIEKENSHIPLNMEKYIQLEKRIAKVENIMDTLLTETSSTSYQTTNNEADKKIFKVNDFSKQLNDECLKKIQNDIYLEESYKIMLDLIKNTTH